MSTFHLQIDNAELIAALGSLQVQLTGSVGQERDRLVAGAIAMRSDSPEWITTWLDATNCVAHFVPGPKLVELLMPLERLELPRPAPVQVPRWRRVARHLREAWEACRG